MGWLLLVLISFSAQAEYRAFLLKISSQDGQDFRLVKSNLDPEQYGTYYPLRAGERVQYTETWMCRGRTNLETEVCDNPKLPPNESSDSKP
jgi:hypothetical protein